jgi:hypothetical protein
VESLEDLQVNPVELAAFRCQCSKTFSSLSLQNRLESLSVAFTGEIMSLYQVLAIASYLGPCC